ncbi:MAG: hypothetical protein ABSE16_06010 [Verrucomicrobiota bacterium]
MNPYFSYLVGGLLATVSPEEETAKLNQCAESGWELVAVAPKKYRGVDYTFFYFRRAITDENPKTEPRFDLRFFAS